MKAGFGYKVGDAVKVKAYGEVYDAVVSHIGGQGAYATFKKGATTKTVMVFASVAGKAASSGPAAAAA